MITTEIKEINGTTYRITTLGFLEGRRVLTKITKLLGPGLAELICTDGAANKSDKYQSLAYAISAFVKVLDDKDLEYLFDTFGKQTEIDHDVLGTGVKSVRLSKDIQNIFFAGKYDDAILWIKTCLEVNFGPLLSTFMQAIKNQ